MTDACDHFATWEWVPENQRDNPEPWRRCTECNQPKAQHEQPRCRSQAIVKGVPYTCALRTPHDGAHRCDDAEWGLG